VLVGGSHTTEREAQLDTLDPRNPATLADRLGEQVGGLLPQALASYVTGVSATVAASLLAVAASQDPSHRDNPLTCLLLILAVRAFGIVASLSGVFAARADEAVSPELALLRGQLSASAVAAFGLGAGLYWLHVEAFVALLIAGLAGLLATALVTQVVWLPLRRTSSGAREMAEARSLGEGAAIARGVGAGLSCLLPALVIPALGLWLVERAPVAPGHAAASQSLLVTAFVAGLLATAPYSMAVAGFGSLCDAAQGFGALARLEPEPRRSGARLEEASTIGGGGAATHASLALAASLLFGLFTLQSRGPAATPPGLELPAILAAIALVLLFGARASRSALQGARTIAEEVRRQLAGLPRRQGALAVPADFTPSYKACVDSALDEARSSSLLAPAVALLVPFAMVVALLGASAARGALLGFATATVLAGLTFTLGSRATRVALREARRRSRGSEASGQAAISHNFGDLVGVGAAASVEALASALALTVLSLASLLG
jgi:K(+)-stimulated pyrophosphate-energized sodium pump